MTIPIAYQSGRDLRNWRQRTRRAILRHWPVKLALTTAVACVVLWFYLPIWAPQLVVDYCPWDGPYFRAALSGGGFWYAGEPQVQAARFGIRYDRALKNAKSDPTAAVYFLKLRHQPIFDGAGSETYSGDITDVMCGYAPEQWKTILAGLPPADRADVIDSFLWAADDGLSLQSTPGGAADTSEEQLAAMGFGKKYVTFVKQLRDERHRSAQHR